MHVYIKIVFEARVPEEEGAQNLIFARFKVNPEDYEATVDFACCKHVCKYFPRNARLRPGLYKLYLGRYYSLKW